MARPRGAVAQLQPEGAGAGGDRGRGHLGGVPGAAEHVDEVDGLGDLVQGGQHGHPEDLQLRAPGVDPEQPVALVVEVPGDLVGGAVGVGERPTTAITLVSSSSWRSSSSVTGTSPASATDPAMVGL
jgi:hypothetical protein